MSGKDRDSDEVRLARHRDLHRTVHPDIADAAKARKDLATATESWWIAPKAAKRPATGEPLFYVVGEHKAQTAYYCGWWHSYGEPLLTHHPSLGAKAMKRAGANRIRRRLENPEIWGGSWRLVPA